MKFLLASTLGYEYYIGEFVNIMHAFHRVLLIWNNNWFRHLIVDYIQLSTVSQATAR